MQNIGVEILNAETEAVEPTAKQIVPVFSLEVAGVTFNGNFGVFYCLKSRQQMFIDATDQWQRH